jgi:hypothetical protein
LRNPQRSAVEVLRTLKFGVKVVLNEEDLKKLKLKVGFTGLIDKQPQTGTVGVEGCFADNQTTGIQVEKYSSTLS